MEEIVHQIKKIRCEFKEYNQKTKGLSKDNSC